MSKPYFLIECANTHGGSIDYLHELIDAFSHYNEGYGIKFQPFHPDKIATQSYSYYGIYQELLFSELDWQEIISKANQTKDVWLDLFDSYGVEIFQKNADKIYGIKFQSSVLENHEVFSGLETVGLNGKKLILNIAAQPVESIKAILLYLEEKLNPEEILLEFGYQAYPTSFEDSGFSKLPVLKKHFSNKLVFADHVDGKSEDAIWLPVLMAMNNVEIIEKHVMLDGRETKYDHYSSITPQLFKALTDKVLKYSQLKEQPFINEKEKTYLQNTRMIPILNKAKAKGTLVDLKKDVLFRRSGSSGLTFAEIKELQTSFHILAGKKEAGEALQREDFKRANIATIIACRLKSSRLPQKALLPIGKLPSVERCIQSCLEFRHTNYTILATSDLEDDAKLEDNTYREDVIFHKGDPDDVIRRYLGIAEKLQIDVIIRITADMPFVSHEIVEKALRVHFDAGADYTAPNASAVGTSAEIINTQALQTVKAHFTSANYSEYMTWYFLNNKEFFNICLFDLERDLIRDYRLTLDYPEDLEMFNKLQSYFDENKIPFDIRKAFKFLDDNPQVGSINQHLTLRYKTDPELIETLNRVTKISN